MRGTLAAVAAPENLTRAWHWLLTNPEASYKNYFRRIYRAYGIAEESNLEALSKRLKNRTYRPVHSTKLFLPKSSGLLRPWTLLSVEDQVVYQAVANVVAERLAPRVRARYEKTVFGNLYAGRNSRFFLRDWRKCYRLFSARQRALYENGYEYHATFDLTACLDSIDHRVLEQFLRGIGVEPEVCQLLLQLLQHWTAHDPDSPVYAGHGIPQGPMASGMIAEALLRHFDEQKGGEDVQYLRYVDDIHLFATDEEALRRFLIALDLASKKIGLFPQSSKIGLRRLQSIEEITKSVSLPTEERAGDGKIDPAAAEERIIELTPRLQVADDTRFKYVLGAATPNARLGQRLLRIVDRRPDLYRSVCRHLEKSTKLPKSVSRLLMQLLRSFEYYPAMASAILRVLRGRVHKDYGASLTTYCSTAIGSRARAADPESRAELVHTLVAAGALSPTQVQRHATWTGNWWYRTQVLEYLGQGNLNPTALEKELNQLVRDPVPDVAAVAAEEILVHGCGLTNPRTDVHRVAQHSLKAGGLIGRVRVKNGTIGEAMTQVLGARVRAVDWKVVLGTGYMRLVGAVTRWASYSESDPTAWVNSTDVINDIVLSRLFSHDTTIGGYTLGKIGSALNRGSKFESSYPHLFEAARLVHEMRLRSELSHPVIRSTNAPTSYIRYREAFPMRRKLALGYQELWAAW